MDTLFKDRAPQKPHPYRLKNGSILLPRAQVISNKSNNVIFRTHALITGSEKYLQN